MKTKKLSATVAEFEQTRPRYVEFCARIKALLETLLQNNQIRIHAVEGRAKTVASFRDKLTRPGKSYEDPLRDMPDLVGIRAILYQPKDVQRVVEIIQAEFSVDESQSSDTLERLAANEFGYRSIHLVCSLNRNRSALAEWAPFTNYQVEFQLRTVLQHAWAAMSHTLQYKKEAAVPDSLKRRLFRLSGLLELADEEFSSLRESHEQLVLDVSTSSDAEIGDLSINKITLAEFVKRSTPVTAAWNAALAAGFLDADKYEGDFDQPAEKEYSSLAAICEYAGIENLSSLSDAIKIAARTRNKYFKELLTATEGEWWASPAFIVHLLVIKSQIKKLTVANLVDIGWARSTAEKVFSVAKPKTVSQRKKKTKKPRAT